MNLRQEFERRIQRKKQEIAELELKAAEANAYVQAMTDAIRILPKDNQTEGVSGGLRSGTMVALAQAALLKAGTPLYVDNLLEAIGKVPNKENRVSLSTSLGGYVRRGVVFTRPAPNTFGLMGQNSDPPPEDDEPPADFGVEK